MDKVTWLKPDPKSVKFQKGIRGVLPDKEKCKVCGVEHTNIIQHPVKIWLLCRVCSPSCAVKHYDKVSGDRG